MDVKRMTDNDLVAQCAKINLKSNMQNFEESLSKQDVEEFNLMWDEVSLRNGPANAYSMVSAETAKLYALVKK